MNIFGWIILSILATFGLGIAVLLVIPFLLSLFKTISYKVKKQIENANVQASLENIENEKWEDMDPAEVQAYADGL